MSPNRRNTKQRHSNSAVNKINVTKKSTCNNKNQNEFGNADISVIKVNKQRTTKLRGLHKKRSAQLSQDSNDMLLDKSVKRKKRNVHKARNKGRATIPITPQMIHGAVRELQTRRVYINSSLIRNYLRRCFPIEKNPEALKAELNEKLHCAVCVGLIAKCGLDKYCMPTLRQQANMNKTAISAFWDTYDKNKPCNTEKNINLELPREKVRAKHQDKVRSRSNSRNYYCEDLHMLDTVHLDDSD